MLYCLWDLRLKVGHVGAHHRRLPAPRPDRRHHPHQPARAPLPLGRRRPRPTGSTPGSGELFGGTGPEFVELKLAERAERHARQGSSRYLLEPNVKEGKGGLRDLQTLFWIAKYLNHAETAEDLVQIGVFTPEEYRIFAEAEAFLWTTRVHLHLLNGRATEQLTFDTQVEIAATLGYRSTEGQRAVERFMQDYFTHAKHVGDLTRIFLAALEARHVKPRPSLGEKLRTVFAFGKDADRPGLPAEARPARLRRRGRLPQGPGQHPAAVRGGARHRHPDPPRRAAPGRRQPAPDRRRACATTREANRIFLDLLLGHNNPERALRLMNEVGVLGAFIPEFGRIVAMMQFNMYHHYTVDEHIIRTISTLSARSSAASSPTTCRSPPTSSPRASTAASSTSRCCCTTSARARAATTRRSAPRSPPRLCPRFGLDAEETELVVWLVQNHLLMSDVAQKRDLTEPRTVRDFAQAVKSPTRLKLLTVLTVCDIRGVGPGVWNNWKAMLLRGLYARDARVPDRRQPGARAGPSARPRPRRRWPTRSPTGAEAEIEAERARHYPPYWLGFDTRTHAIFAELVRQLAEAEPAMAIELDFDRDATQACFAMSDHPGIFARLAGALALAGANVVDARTYTTTDGIATAAFWIQDAEGKPYEKARLTRLRNAVTRTLKRRDRRPRGAEGQGQDQEARARLRRADPDQLRQHRLGHLHHHRGRDPRPPGPALRPRPHADRQQHLDRLARSSPPTASRRSTSSTSRTSSA